MTAPFGYGFFPQTPYMWQFCNQPYVSPFVPPMAPLPPSPRVIPQPERRVRFEDDESPFPRQRCPSWHGALAAPPNPVPFPSPPIILTPLPPAYPLPAQPSAMPPFPHHRRHSDTSLPQPYWVTYPTMLHPVAYSSPAREPVPQIHPLLNGENAAGPKIIFDLSLHTFNPQRVTSYTQTSGTALSPEELLQPATHPPVYHMTITNEQIPEWPIALERHTTPRERSRERSPFLSVSEREAEDAPITVYDVLMAVYRTVQWRIAQADWRRLTVRQTNEVSKAYTRRCRAYPSAEAFEENQGVRRVDYLLERYMFRGIMRESGADGFARMKLLVGEAR